MKQRVLTSEFLVSLFACESAPQMRAANEILAEAERGETAVYIEKQAVLDALGILTSRHRYSKKAVAAGFLATLSNPGVFADSTKDIVQLLEAYARGDSLARNANIAGCYTLPDLPKRLEESDGPIGESA